MMVEIQEKGRERGRGRKAARNPAPGQEKKTSQSLGQHRKTKDAGPRGRDKRLEREDSGGRSQAGSRVTQSVRKNGRAGRAGSAIGHPRENAGKGRQQSCPGLPDRHRTRKPAKAKGRCRACVLCLEGAAAASFWMSLMTNSLQPRRSR